MNEITSRFDRATLGRIMQLAQRREKDEATGEHESRFQWTPGRVQTESAIGLKQVIDGLEVDKARALLALMYVGRDGLQGASGMEAWQAEFATASARAEVDVKRSLFEKAPLAMYLRQGLDLLDVAF